MSQATIRIPTPLRTFTAGAAEVTVEGDTVAEALHSLTKVHSELKRQILNDKDKLRNFVNIFVGDKNIRSLAGLESPVPEGAIIHIVPAVAGGGS